jgi:hypothetical protein
MRVHLGEDRLGQPVTLQQMPEVEDRGLVGDAVIGSLRAYQFCRK